MNTITDEMIVREIQRLAMLRNYELVVAGPQSMDVRLHRNMCVPLKDSTTWTLRFGALEISFNEYDRLRSINDFSENFLLGLVASVVPLTKTPAEMAIDEIVSIIGNIRDGQGYGGLGVQGESKLRNALVEFLKALNSND